MHQMAKNENKRRNLKRLEKRMEYCLTLRREHVMTMVKMLKIWKEWPVRDTEFNVYRIVIYISWTIMCVVQIIVFMSELAYNNCCKFCGIVSEIHNPQSVPGKSGLNRMVNISVCKLVYDTSVIMTAAFILCSSCDK